MECSTKNGVYEYGQLKGLFMVDFFPINSFFYESRNLSNFLILLSYIILTTDKSSVKILKTYELAYT